MKSTYVGRQQISIGCIRTSRNSSVSNQGIFELGKLIAHLNSRDHIIFQRIVDSIKFNDPEYSHMLAVELSKVRLIKIKLTLIKNEIVNNVK